MSYVQHIAGGQNPARVTAESPEDERAPAAEIIGNGERAGNRDIRATARRLRVRHLQYVPSLHRNGAPGGQRSAEIGARDGDDRVAGKPQGRTGDRDFEPGGRFRTE